jgi:hypothetical protein
MLFSNDFRQRASNSITKLLIGVDVLSNLKTSIALYSTTYELRPLMMALIALVVVLIRLSRGPFQFS